MLDDKPRQWPRMPWMFLALLVGLPFGARPAQARETLVELRTAVLEKMQAELAARGFHVFEPDLSDPNAKTAFKNQSFVRIRARKGGASGDEAYEVPNWKLKQLDRMRFNKPTPYETEQLGTLRWGRPSEVQVSLHLAFRKPKLEGTTTSSRPRKAAFRVDWRNPGKFEVAPRSGSPMDRVSRLIEGQKIQRSVFRKRTFGGLDGCQRAAETSGLLHGRPTVGVYGGGFIYDAASQGTRTDRMTLEARDKVAAGWIHLTVDATRPIHADPARLWTPSELEYLMSALVEAYRLGATARGGTGRVRIFDANPLYTRGRAIRELDGPDDLRSYVTKERKGIVADGVTRVVLEVEMDEPGVLRLEVPPAEDAPLDPGQVEMLFGGRSSRTDIEGEPRYVAYALYTAPRSFAEPRGRVQGSAPAPGAEGKAKRRVAILASTGPNVAELAPSPTPVELPLHRPPVILVHGTFDTPMECWESHAGQLEPAAGTLSMAEVLRGAGYTVFTVDYSQTNGRVNNSLVDQSSFSHNCRVFWENPQGAYDALRVYRDELGLAVAQVDVVGHSLGGLIPRLWISEHYNKNDTTPEPRFDREATRGYRRPDNFEAGDIHRLVTIGTTHLGSDLGHLGAALEGASSSWLETILAESPMPVLTRKNIERILFLGLGAGKGMGISKVVHNQRPIFESLPNPALAAIGPSRVPSHAIVCSAAIPDVSTFGGLYRYAFKAVAWWMLNARPEVVREFFEARGQVDELDRIYGELIDLDQRMQRDGEAAGSWLFDPRVRIGPRDRYTIYGIARAILFGNTQNDFVVRVESQAGGLPLQYTTFCRRVLHSFATRYTHVQQAVAEALTGPEWRFSPDGFPAPVAVRNVEEYEVEQDPVGRRTAVEASNIVPSHAEALSYVAHKQGIVIVMRPVNKHAEPLIANNLATKDMHVKGKSSNWGPQRGYIPVKQRFSKLHLLEGDRRAKDINKFDGKVTECLQSNRARERALQIAAGGATYDVLFVEGEDLDPPRSIVLRNEAGEYRGWQRGDSLEFDPSGPLPDPPLSADEIARRGVVPLTVLSDRHTGIALTADYDILAFGPKFDPGDVESHPEMGFVNAWQRELIRKMNNEVRLRANYAGGNVSHHGPETQFVFSEGADYPNTAFEPDGDIRIILEGPPGQKDYNLKRYFHVMRVEGYKFEPNKHTWNWGEYNPERWPVTGWRPDDRLQISAKVLAEDNPFDSDEGDELSPSSAAVRGAR